MRVIDAEGNQLGVMNTPEALQLAQQSGMDLVEVAPHAQPPVCRILDYGKHTYEQAKRQRETRRQQKESGAIRSGGIKGVRIRFGTDSGDLDYRVKDARRFLEEGNKVEVTLLFRGRERTHPEIAEAQLTRISEALVDIALVEQTPRVDGRRMTMLLAPR